MVKLSPNLRKKDSFGYLLFKILLENPSLHFFIVNGHKAMSFIYVCAKSPGEMKYYFPIGKKKILEFLVFFFLTKMLVIFNRSSGNTLFNLSLLN